MNAADLIQLAQARGIDLKYVAGAASRTDGIARKRQRTKEEIDHGLPLRESVTGRQTRVYRRPSWTVAELGQAANGLGAVPWAALCYSVAGFCEPNEYKVLWHALANEAGRLSRRENWPMEVVCEDGKRRCYREHLAKLVLIEEANRHFFAAAPQLYAIVMEVPAPVWDRQLSDPFRSLKSAYERWLGIGLSVIGRWIREPDNNVTID